MARKLSTIAPRLICLAIAGGVSLAASGLLAQQGSPAVDPLKFIDNPFVKAQPPAQAKPEPQSAAPGAAEKPQLQRRPITYQNPFSATSKAPPVDTSLRPGPISRWRHPAIPGHESSPVKSAVLATPHLKPEPRRWDVLPPAEDLRRANGDIKESDPTFYSRLTKSSGIQFNSKALTQPNWLTEFDEAAVPKANPIEVDAAVFNSKLNQPSFATPVSTSSPDLNLERSQRVANAFDLESLYVEPAAEPAANEVSPSIVSNCVDTPEGCLEQAQQAATKSTTPEELSGVIELCERGLRATPDVKLALSLRRLAAWAHNRRGEIRADNSEPDEALSDFQLAISLDPNCSLAIHNRAVTLAQQNQFTAALRDFNRVIELNPGLAIAYQNRAELLAAIDRTEDAIADYNQAIECLPNDPHLYRARAYAYQRLGNVENAFADFNRAIEIAPNDPDCYTQRGNLAAEQSNYGQAIGDFRRALAKDPNWTEAHRSLAWLLATCPNPDFQNSQQALEAAEQAVKLGPANDFLILDTLAASCASAGNFEKAIEVQQQALSNAPAEQARPLEQRLALYRSGRPFRNAATASDAR
jgi:tetratricopeptide (TPR) repeat protein